MRAIGVFNRDGGTFKTTDMDAFAARASEIFAAHGHEFEARVVEGEIMSADIATANGRPFIHQFSVGIHAKLVKLRETLTYRSRIGKMVASSRAFLGALGHAPIFFADVVTKRGVERRATSGISVSNNPLEGALPHAPGLDAGVLGIYVIAPLTPWVVARLSWGAVRGRWKALPEVSDREAREVTIRFPRKKRGAVAVIDGELVKLAEVVELKIHPGALQVVRPRATRGENSDNAEPVATPA